MTHTLTDAQSLTIADALTHTLSASEMRYSPTSPT